MLIVLVEGTACLDRGAEHGHIYMLPITREFELYHARKREILGEA